MPSVERHLDQRVSLHVRERAQCLPMIGIHSHLRAPPAGNILFLVILPVQELDCIEADETPAFVRAFDITQKLTVDRGRAPLWQYQRCGVYHLIYIMMLYFDCVYHPYNAMLRTAHALGVHEVS